MFFSLFFLWFYSRVSQYTILVVVGNFPSFVPLTLRSCSSSGHAAYATAVDLYPDNAGVGATYFMTYHTILKESPDYIHALKMARNLADNITQSTNHKVFAYR